MLCHWSPKEKKHTKTKCGTDQKIEKNPPIGNEASVEGDVVLVYVEWKAETVTGYFLIYTDQIGNKIRKWDKRSYGNSGGHGASHIAT
jgi:hypothetical protein